MGMLTSRLLAETLANGTGGLEVNVPARGLTLGVLKGEAEDGLALLDGIFALLLALQRGGNAVKGPRRGELVCSVILLSASWNVPNGWRFGDGDDGVTCQQHVPSLRAMIAVKR